MTKEHALFRWVGDGWEMRDLSSRNGTFLDGKKLEQREQVRVELGSLVAFGDPEDIFEMIADSPPVFARSEDGDCLEATGNELHLPDAENPELIVYNDGEAWCIEDVIAGESRRARNGEEVQFGDRIWHLSVPEVEVATSQLERPQGMELFFDVSVNQEHITITVIQDGTSTVLPNRSHSYLLLVLARERLEGANNRELPEQDRGWVHMDDLTRMLRANANQIGSLIFRAKKQFREAGLLGADGIVESRSGTGERRIGVSRIVIRP